MESSFHIQLHELPDLTGFAADAVCADIALNTGSEWIGGLVHPLAPERESAQARLCYATLMTVCEATVRDQVDVFQSELSLETVKLVPENEEIGFR
jgi:hypothetical protein